MAIQKIQRKSGVRYRVQMMRNGKRLSKVFTKKKEAEQFHAQLLTNDDLTNLLTGYAMSNLTLNEACKEYLSYHTGKDQSIGQRLSWWCSLYGDKKAGQVTKSCVRAALKALSGEGKAPATINRYKAALSAVYAFLSDEYDSTHNPAREVKQLKENNARTRFLTDKEVERLLNTAKESSWERLYLLLLMAITTGARRTEILTLRWSDISIQDRRALVKKTKNGEPRILPLTDNVIAELTRFQSISTDYVFPRIGHQHDYFRNFDTHWYRAIKVAGIKDCRFHDLRHTAASILAKNGASLIQIAEVLGHKSIQMTQRYAHLCASHKHKLIDDFMGEISSGRRHRTA
ncbi:site-specific integrase [Vibrio campbellii]|uniref:tyrosine-type recombinase/integrase n=1 Tax=Vibrio sp. LB10LO1 TaxID=2711207 RepID=UPI00138A63FC|nr:site-specific integrase [Vibrio sp. LB10LO1]NDJ82369.1 site-specific integrase [Vibrio sp. LB10LO1]